MKDKIKEVVKKHLGSKPSSIEKTEEGLVHETYSFTAGGEDYIIQFAGDDHEHHDSLDHCLKMYELLANTVPVPEAVTGEVQEIDGEKYIIVEKIEGKTAEQDINPEKVRTAGKYLAKIHDFTELEKPGWIVFENGLEVEEFEDGGLKQYKLRKIGEKLETLRDAGFEELADRLEEFFEENEAVFPEEFTPVICHDDYTPDNVLYSGDKLTGVIDFDFAYAGHAERNLVKAANSFWMHDPGADWDIRETFYNGYREERPVSEDFDRLEPFYRVETLVQLIAGLIGIGELSEEEIEFYKGEILGELEKE